MPQGSPVQAASRHDHTCNPVMIQSHAGLTEPHTGLKFHSNCVTMTQCSGQTTKEDWLDHKLCFAWMVDSGQINVTMPLAAAPEILM